MFSFGWFGARKAFSLCTLIFALSLAPAFAVPVTISLVPAITTITGNGSPGVPASNPILASSAQNLGPIAVTTDVAGNVYFSDGQYNVVWKINRATGIMAIIAGQPGGSGHSGDGGPATMARFAGPEGLRLDTEGNLYIVDSGNFTVRKVDTAGIITTVAGIPHVAGQTGDGGLATSARIGGPSYLALDGANNLYIADLLSNAIRRVDAITHIITTVAGDPTSARAAGQSGDGGLATSALLHSPNGIAFDASGNLYIADRGNNAIRKVDAVTQIITTVAGDPTAARASGSSGDGGPATSALLNFPWSVGVDRSGNLFIADFLNAVVREVSHDGKINTVAGTLGSGGFSGDGGAATAAQLSNPDDVAFDAADNMYITDLTAGTLRMVNLRSSFPSTTVGSASATQNLILHVTGTVTITGFTVPPSQGGIAEYVTGSLSGTGCALGSPIAGGGFGVNCRLAATFHPGYPGLRSVPLLVNTTVAATPKTFQLGITGLGLGSLPGFDSGIINTVPVTLLGSGPHYINGVTLDSQGNLYLVDAPGCLVEKLAVTTAILSRVAGNGTCAESGDGGLAIDASFNEPLRVAVSRQGDLYITDDLNFVVRKVDAVTGLVSVVAGVPGSFGYGGDGVLATTTTLTSPEGVVLDSAGNLYIEDSPKLVRRVDAITGIITTVAGDPSQGTGYSGDGGVATAAQMNHPLGLAIDSAANLYIADASNNVIRKVSASTGLITTVAGHFPNSCTYTGDGGAATAADLCDPEGLTVDAAGNLYIADSTNDVIRKVSAATGIITTVAGLYNNGTDAYTGDGGSAKLAGLSYQQDVAIDGMGNLYLDDANNSVIRKVTPANAIATFANFYVGSSSPPIDVELSNNGNAELNLSAVTPPINFNLNGSNTSCTASTTLAAGESCDLGIEFLPTTPGLLSGTLTLTDNASNHSASTQSVTLSGTGQPTVATTTVLTATPSAPVAGAVVTFTATITPTPTGSPLGTVKFYNGTTLIGTETVNAGGVATLSLTTLPAGTDVITAVYSGSMALASSTSAAITVHIGSTTRAATATTLTSSSPGPEYGQNVTLTATISPAPTDAPPGTVSFYSGTTLLGTQAVGAHGLAAITTSLRLGPNALTAVYSGSARFGASTSSTLSVSARAASAIALSASPATQLATMAIVFTAQVSSEAGDNETGTVTFLNGATALSTVTVVAGQAKFTETALSSGVYSVTASYSGDSNFLPSASTGAPVAVTVADLNLALGGDTNKGVVPGGAVTYNFPLSPLVTPTFLYDVTLTATGLPAGATYTFSPSTIPAGSGTLPVAFTVQTAKTTAMLESKKTPWLALAFGLLLPLAGAKRLRLALSRAPRPLQLLLLGALSLSVAAGLGGCGTAGFFGKPQGQTNYTITVSATSGTLVRTSTVQLNLE